VSAQKAIQVPVSKEGITCPRPLSVNGLLAQGARQAVKIIQVICEDGKAMATYRKQVQLQT